MSATPTPGPPREPEIEFLGKLAHGFLAVARFVLWLAGVAAIAYGTCRAAGIEPIFTSFLLPDSTSSDQASASSVVWFTLGLPLVLPADWLLTKNRHRIWILIVSALTWFVPMLFGDSSSYGYILRMFATLISFLSLLVWRTLWQLTKPAEPAT